MINEGEDKVTKKLYYEDAYKKQFESKVVACEAYKDKFAVVLEATAFYPEGGGQSSDQGELINDEAHIHAKVTHVFIKEEIIYHVVDVPLEVGVCVVGTIDFKRRFDMMQQHSGEHILSGLINKHYGYNNVGFHLGETYMTADFDGELTKDQLREIERLSNEAIYKNIPVVAKLYTQEEAMKLSYRSKIEITGLVRVVTIGDYDACACCGTHVNETGEIGIIKCTDLQRHRGGVRITMLCGQRALADYEMKQEITTEVGAKLSTKPEAITTSVDKLQEELGSLKQKLAAYKMELFAFKAKEYARAEASTLCILEEDLVGDELRKLCLALTAQTPKICLVLTGEMGNYKYALGSSAMDIRDLAKSLNKEFDGRGGGSSELCQGSLKGEFKLIEAFMNSF